MKSQRQRTRLPETSMSFYGFFVVVHPDSSLYDLHVFKTRANARLLPVDHFPCAFRKPAAAAPRRHQLPRSFEIQAPRFGADGDSLRSYRNARQGNPPAVPSSPCRKTDNSRQDSPPRRSASALWWKNRRIVFYVVFREKVVEIFVVAHVHQMPVIQPRPA